MKIREHNASEFDLCLISDMLYSCLINVTIGQSCHKVHELSAKIKTEWDSLNENERSNVTEAALQELTESCEVKYVFICSHTIQCDRE